MHLSYLSSADQNATTHPIDGLYDKTYQEKFDAKFKDRLKAGDTHDDAATAAHVHALENAGVQTYDMTAEEKKSNTIANILYQARAAGFTDPTLLADLVTKLNDDGQSTALTLAIIDGTDQTFADAFVLARNIVSGYLTGTGVTSMDAADAVAKLQPMSIIDAGTGDAATTPYAATHSAAST
jgi:hypothetical protein